jgi:hypothetical protein
VIAEALEAAARILLIAAQLVRPKRGPNVSPLPPPPKVPKI